MCYLMASMRRVRRAPQTWYRALLALLLACACFSGALLGGQLYGWCVAMDRPMPECCMHALRQKQQPSRGPQIERHTFEMREIAKLPTTTAPAATDLTLRHDAPVLAVFAPEPFRAREFRASAVVTAPAPESPEPVGVGPPAARVRRALLQIYRC